MDRLKRIPLFLASLLTAVLCFAPTRPVHALVGEYWGYVSGRGIVFDNEGYATWVSYGPTTSYPVWRTNDEGQQVQGSFLVAGEKIGELPARDAALDAIVISGDEFRYYAGLFVTLSHDPANVGKYELLTKTEFRSREFRDTAGTVLPVALSAASTQFVMVRSPVALTPGTPVILAEFPVNPLDGSVGESTKSVLVSTQEGSEGQVIWTSTGVIAYLVDFVTPRSAQEQAREPRLGYCAESVLADGKVQLVNGSTADFKFEDRATRFLRCDPFQIGETTAGDAKVWGPLAGAYVENGWSGWYGGAPAITDANGKYLLHYKYDPGTEGWDDIHVLMSFAPQNQRVPFGSRFFYKRVVQGGATFRFDDRRAEELANEWANSQRSGLPPADAPLVGAIGGPTEVANYMAWMAGLLEDTQTPRGYNIPIDVAYILGKVEMRNEQRPGVGLDASTRLAIEIDDVESRTQYGYVRPRYPTSGIQTTRDANGNEVVNRWEANGEVPPADDGDDEQPPGILSELVDRGLVNRISRADIARTDLFVFSADGALAGSRLGLRTNESPGIECEGNETKSPFGYTGACPAGGATPDGDHHDCLVCRVPTRDTPYPAAFDLQTFVSTQMPGSRYGILLINRATGYIGTGYVKMTDDQALQLATTGALPNGLDARPIYSRRSVIGDQPGIVMRPPNLKVTAQRCSAAGCPSDAGQGGGVIGFEGAGLNSDSYIRLETELKDWDGTALPNLPANYALTGRIARVAIDPSVVSDPLTRVSDFSIPVDNKLTWVRVSESETNNYHYYVHVSGESKDGCATNKDANCKGFVSSTEAGPLRFRPANYAPFKVPVYDADATKSALEAEAILTRQAGRDLMHKVAPIYSWVYRPEYQFSVYELPELKDAVVLTEYNQNGQTSSTSLSFTYSLTTSEGLSRLPTLGSDSTLLWSVGYNELVANLGEDVPIDVPNLDTLLGLSPGQQLNAVANIASSLEPADYLGLQLYSANDRGNALYENYSVPVFSATAMPIRLDRRVNNATFGPSIGNLSTIEDYRAIPFSVTMDAKVSLYAETKTGEKIRDIYAGQDVPAGPHYFVLNTATLNELGLPSEFTAVLEGEVLDPTGSGSKKTAIPHRVKYPVIFNTRRSGDMLGQILEHDVNILDGSLQLTRQDFALEGLGPNLAFQRNYNSNNGSGGVLGPGWSHSYDLELTPIETTEYAGNAAPGWLTDLRPFPAASQIEPHLYPAAPYEFTAVTVNGSTFRRGEGDLWISEVGRHGTLLQLPITRCSEQDAVESGCFVYIAPDLTEYRYPIPPIVAGTPPSYGSARTTISLADGLATRAGLDPASLSTGAATQVAPATRATGFQPVKLRSITDRFGNRSNFTYNTRNLVERVEDAVGRACQFNYSTNPDCTPFDGADCARLENIHCLDPDDVAPLESAQPVVIDVNFRYSQGRLTEVERGRRRERYSYVSGSGAGSGSDSNLETVTKVLGGSAGNAVTTYRYRNPAEGQTTFTPIAGREPVPLYDMVQSVEYPPTITQNDALAALTVSFEYPSSTERRISGGIPKTYTLNAVGNPTRIVEGSGTKVRTTELTWSIDDASGAAACHRPNVPNDYGQDNVLLARRVSRGDKDLTTSFAYDGKGRVIAECGPGPRWIEQTWTEYGEPSTRQDWRSRNVERWYYEPLSPSENNVSNSAYFLYRYVNGAGVATEYTPSLTTRGRIETATVAGSVPPRTTTYAYDEYGHQSSTTVGNTLISNRQLDARGRPIFVFDANGRRTHNVYTTNDELDHVELPDVTPPGGLTSPFAKQLVQILHYEYDDAGNRTFETDRNGLELVHEYTPLGQVRQTTRSYDGAAKQIRYDILGNVIAEQDWELHWTRYGYDGLGYRHTTTNRLGHEMTTEHDLLGNVTLTTDFEQHRTQIQYNDLNTEESREILDCSDDDCGEREVTSLPLPVASHVESTVMYTVTKTNAREFTTTLGYDGLDRLVYRRNAEGGTHIWRYDPSGALSDETNEEGLWTQHIYDNRGYEIRTILHSRGGAETISTDMVTDDKGNVTQIRSNNQSGPVQKDMTYDAWDRMATRSISGQGTEYIGHDPGQMVELFDYDGQGNLVASRDAGGRTRAWARDPLGRVLTYLDAETALRPQPLDFPANCGRPGSFTTCNVYNPNGTLARTVNARGVETTYSYDAEDRETSHTQHASGFSRTAHVRSRDRMGNPTVTEDYRGFQQILAYTPRYLLSSKTDAEGNRTQYTYNAAGKVASELSPAPGSFRRRYTYDAMDRVQEVHYTNHHGQEFRESRQEYDLAGNPTNSWNVSNALTEKIYDGFLRHEDTFVTNSAGTRVRIVHNEYDEQGNVTAVTDAANHRVVQRYTPRNLQWRTDYPDGQAVTRTFYQSGKVQSETQPGNYTTSFEYDAEDRLVSSTIDGERTSFTYDLTGNRTSETQPEGQVGGKYPGRAKHYAYDAFGRLASVLDEVNIESRYAYDNNDNLTDQYGPEDPNAQFTLPHVQFGYDRANRRVSDTRHLSETEVALTEYGNFDTLGNPQTVTRPLFEVSYDYDEYGRVIATTLPSIARPGYQVASVTREYDDLAKTVVITQQKQSPQGVAFADETTEIRDRGFDWLLSSTQRGTTIGFDYYPTGTRQQVASPAGVTGYSYDSRNRLTRATLGTAPVDYEYDDGARTMTLTYPNGTSALYQYGAAGRVESITHSFVDATSTTISYQYDHNGNPTSITDTTDGIADVTGPMVYDAAGRLREFSQDGRTTIYTYEGYDRKIETLLQGTNTGTVISERTYNYDQDRRLTSVSELTPGNAAVVTSYDYDLHGNLLQRRVGGDPSATTNFVYNTLDQLVRVTRGPPGSEEVLGDYDYDSYGKRIRHIGDDRGDVTSYYDENAVLEEVVTGGTGNNALRFHYGTTVLGMVDGPGYGDLHYFHQDLQRTTRHLSDASGLRTTSYKHDPWGKVREQTGDTTDNRLTYTQQQHDNRTGLYYYGARFYDPQIGRFLTADTWTGDTKNPPSLHRYLYAYSNPARYTDPTGHAPVAANGEGAFYPANQNSSCTAANSCTPNAPTSTSAGNTGTTSGEATYSGSTPQFSVEPNAARSEVARSIEPNRFVVTKNVQDPNDPRNYSDFASFREGSKGPLTDDALRHIWNSYVESKQTPATFAKAGSDLGDLPPLAPTYFSRIDGPLTAFGEARNDLWRATANGRNIVEIGAGAIAALPVTALTVPEETFRLVWNLPSNAQRIFQRSERAIEYIQRGGDLDYARALIDGLGAVEDTTQVIGGVVVVGGVTKAAVSTGSQALKPKIPTDQGVYFFDKEVATLIDKPSATLGRPGKPHFFMPLEDAAEIRTAADAARQTGNAPSVVRAYLADEPVYGVSFPTRGLAVRKPTTVDAEGWPHFFEQGTTATRGAGPNGGYMINSTPEFVVPGGAAMPQGSLLFELGPNGAWIPKRRF